MSIRIDGDACPFLQEIISFCSQLSIPVYVYCDFSHMIQSDYAVVQMVDSAYQMVDMVLIEQAKVLDLVITQDYGLAQLLLGKGCCVCNTKGEFYTDETIDQLLWQRYCFQKQLKTGRKKGPKKRTYLDNLKLLEAIQLWLIGVKFSENGFKNGS